MSLALTLGPSHPQGRLRNYQVYVFVAVENVNVPLRDNVTSHNRRRREGT